MSFAKAHTIDGMKLEETEVKNNTHEAARKAYRKAVTERNTFYTLGLLVLKHKMPILITGNVLLIMNWAFPQWFELVRVLAAQFQR